MSLAFDTSVLIAIERGDENILNKLKELYERYPLSPHLPFMVHFEFSYGLKKRKPKRVEDLFDFLNSFPLLDLGFKTSDILSDLKLKYEKKGLSFSLSDLLIAAQVIENDLILVTRDRDFEGIRELKKIIL
jgi:predicted nucleic acid-binding protein